MEEKGYMEFSFDFRSLMDPKKRLFLGLLLLVIGIGCVLANTQDTKVTRDNCVTMDVTFDDCKFRSLDESIDSNSIYLTFKDYTTDLDIHPSCANDRLTEDLMDLRSGTKMQIVVNEDTRRIYELKVAGETWLSFDEAIEKIDNNMNLLDKVSYAILIAGALCLLTVVVSVVWRAIRKEA